MKNIAIYGAGGLGREVEMIINQINRVEKKYNIIGFFDDSIPEGTYIGSYKIIGGYDQISKKSIECIVVAIGDLTIRRELINKLKDKYELPSIIYPSINIPENSIIGNGVIIFPNVFISTNVKIGNGVLINVGCSIGHDVCIGDYCTINPGAIVSGTVEIGNSVFVGVGAIINNNISIVENVKIGAGAVVLKSIIKTATLFGNPARIVL